MKTPIYDFVKNYNNKGIARLHMPGHKGKKYLGFEDADITEIKGADSLYEAGGIIEKSEKNATKLFGSKKTFFSTEGSSQCIKAMLYLALREKKGNKRVVLATRNSHKSFIYACALLNIKVVWLFDEGDGYSLCKCEVKPETLRSAIKRYKPFAVCVTSPDYLGNMLDIKELADVTHSFNIPLLVDNAHGAYLKFLKEDIHPISLGADICCDSAHKTLPVLTGGAYLHIGNERYVKGGKEALEIFGSTSPSYLILQSLDIANKYITEGYEKKLELAVKKVNSLKNKLKELGYILAESDPLKLTVVSSGMNLSEKLRKKGIETEYEDPDYTVLMFTPDNTKEDFEKVYTALSRITPCKEKANLTFVKPKVKLSLKKAVFSQNERVKTKDAKGRILASPTAVCPPAVYPVVSGEIINRNTIEILTYYGIDEISVVI